MAGDRPRDPFVGDLDVFVRDLAAGVTTLVSANATGTGSANGPSQDGSFSPDGSRVLFVSRASDLGPTDSRRPGEDVLQTDVYVRDLAAGATTLVSANAAGTDSGNGRSEEPVRCQVSSQLPGPCWDLYVRDLRTGRFSMVSVNAAGTNGGNGNSAGRGSRFSPVGARLAYASFANDLGPVDSDRPGHPDEDEDIYVATVTPPP